MGIFSRFRAATNAERKVTPEIEGFATALVEFSQISERHRVSLDHTEVVADYGALMERNAGKYHIRSAKELPHSKDLIRAAQDVALNDSHYRDVRAQVLASVDDLENYLSDEELAPYQAAVDAMALTMNLLASAEHRRLMELDPDAAIKVVGALPNLERNATAALERLIRRRRSQRWIELATKYTHLFDAVARDTNFLHWMYAHAADVYSVMTEALAALTDADRDEAAAGRFKRTVTELDGLAEEALAYPAPVGSDEKDKWEVTRSLTMHAYDALRQFVLAVTSDGQERDEAALEGARRKLGEVLSVLKQFDESHEALQKALVDRFLDKSPTPTS